MKGKEKTCDVRANWGVAANPEQLRSCWRTVPRFVRSERVLNENVFFLNKSWHECRVYPQGNRNPLYMEVLLHVLVAVQPGTVGILQTQNYRSCWFLGAESISHYDVTLRIWMWAGWMLWMREVPEKISCIMRDSFWDLGYLLSTQSICPL